MTPDDVIILHKSLTPFRVSIVQSPENDYIRMMSSCCDSPIYFDATNNDPFWYCNECRVSQDNYQTTELSSIFFLGGSRPMNKVSIEEWISYWTGLSSKQFTASVMGI